MSDYFYAFLLSLGTMAVIDAAWLGFIAPKFYKKYLGFILADKPDKFAAIAFYLIFILGMTVFVVYPGWQGGQSFIHIGLRGALLGFVTYATYDLTNQATLKKWPRIVTLVDMVWGTLLTTVVSIVAVAFLKILVK